MGWIQRVRATFGSSHDEEFVEEMRFHIEQRTEEFVREGLTPAQARQRAERQFGNAASLRERTRDADSLRWLRDLIADLRYGWRTLARNPGLAIVATATLALGIGANTAIFAAAYGVLLRPLPYPDSSRLVRLSEFHEGAVSPLPDDFLSDRTFAAWAEHGRTLEGLAAYGERAYTVTGIGDAERVRATAVSPAFFACVGLPPAAGRYFSAEESVAGADRVAVLSHGYWQRQFGGRVDAIGRTLTLDGRAVTVVGVAPAALAFPSAEAQFYTPFVRAAREADRMSVFFAIGRLRPGVTSEQAEAEGTALTRGLGPRPVAATLLFGEGGDVSVRVRTIVDQQTRMVRPVLQLLMAGVALVLVLGCANVGGLLLTLGVTREREFSVRAALGAGRGRLFRQLLAEGLALALAAAVAGVGLAWALIRAWPAIVPGSFPRLAAVQLDEVPLAAALATALAAALMVGLVPALHGAHVRSAGLADARGATLGQRSRRTRQALLVLQAGVAVVLVVAAALLLQSVDRLLRRDSGFDADHVVTARVTMPDPSSPVRFQQMAAALIARLQSVPDVRAAGAANMAPLGDSTHIAGFRLTRPDAEPRVARGLAYVVSPDYPSALRLRLREGRLFTAADETAPTVPVIVNEAFVRAFLNDGQPVAGREYVGIIQPGSIAEIIGVVGDTPRNGLTDRSQPEFYVVLGNHGSLGLNREIYLAVRASVPAAELAPELRGIVRSIDANAAIHAIRDLDEALAGTAGSTRLAAAAVTTFAAIALALAAIGLYGGLMYAVMRRTREMGVRTALGATPIRIMGLVLRESASITGIGLAIGISAASLLTSGMRGLLFGVEPLDPTSFAIAPAILALVAAVASVVPASRAIAIDPVDAIREE